MFPKRISQFFFLFIKVAIGGGSGTGLLNVYNENLELVNSFKAHTNNIYRIKQSPYANGYVATVAADAKVKIWNITNINNWTLIKTYSGHTHGVFGLEFLNEDTIASGSNDDTIKIWAICSGVTYRTINACSDVNALQLLSNGYYLAAGLWSSSINIYNVITGDLIASLAGHKSTVYDLVLINSNLLASSSNDQTVRIWNLTSYTQKFNLTGHSSNVRGLKVASFDILLSGSSDHTIKMWNITSGSLIRTLKNHTASILCSLDLYSSDTFLSGSQDYAIKLWHVKTGKLLNTVYTNLSIYSLAVVNPTITSKFLDEVFAFFKEHN